MESFCPKCGAPGWAYDGDKLACDACGHTRALPRHARAIEAQALKTPAIIPPETGLGWDSTQVWTCGDCSGQVLSMAPPKAPCPYCGGTLQNDPDTEVPEVQKPALVLPFTLSREGAKQKLKSWLDPNILRPPNLRQGFHPDGLHALYVPFWMYDILAEATWKAVGGYLYFNRLQEEDPHDTGEPWEVQRIRYADTGGYYAHTFQHMLIAPEKGSLHKNLEKLMEDEELKEVVPYDPRYAQDFHYAVSKSDPEKATATAASRIEEQVEKAAGEEVDADLHRDVQLQLRTEGLSLRQVLLPVWVVTMQYRGKSYHACIHGRTGKIEGQQPWSPIRVGILISVLVLLIFLLVVLFEKGL